MKRLAQVLAVLTVAFVLVPAWWWALFGLSEQAGKASAITAGVFGLLTLGLGMHASLTDEADA